MNSGKIVAGRVDGTDRGSIRGPRGPKNVSKKSLDNVKMYLENLEGSG